MLMTHFDFTTVEVGDVDLEFIGSFVVCVPVPVPVPVVVIAVVLELSVPL